MRINCGIVSDLLPLYVDGICSDESKALVEAHLAECEACRSRRENMVGQDCFVPQGSEEIKLTNGLKRMKSRLNRRMMIAVGCALAAALAVFIGFAALNVQPLKSLGPQDVSVIAEVYDVTKLPLMEGKADEASVVIRKGEDDTGDTYSVQIPSIPEAELTITQNVLDEAGHLTVISWTSKYHIRLMTWRDGDDEGTLYVDTIKTSLLNNRAEEKFETQKMIEMSSHSSA